ncbi:MAG TPA: ATP-binding protein [Nannocystis sp.]
MTLEELERLLTTPAEHERLEFKRAQGGFSRDKVADYCAALYNEGGGRLILGVTDSRPRQVVGTSAFANTLQETKHDPRLQRARRPRGDPQRRQPPRLPPRRLPLLLELGAIERRGRGRYILGARFYAEDGNLAEYSRRRGLDRETNMALLLAHIRRVAEVGSPMEELEQVLPALTRVQVRKLVYELRDRGLVRMIGKTRAARWFPEERSDV